VSLLAHFLVYNLLVSLVGGLLAWLVVLAVIHLLDIRSSALSFCFFSLALFKSLFLLLGIGLILPWPAGWFGKWHDLALSFKQVLPFFLLWAGTVYLVFYFAVRRARQVILEEVRSAAEAAPRLQSIFEAVLAEFKDKPCPECSDDLCTVNALGQTPRLMISGRAKTPLALTGAGDSIILFPSGLIPQLNDVELAGALAHELAHLVLRRPNWCSASTLQKLTLIVPMAGLVGEYLRHQEERACDELAVSIVEQPGQYAGMLTKSFRFARGQPGQRIKDWLQILPRLVGFKPLLSERVEQLVGPRPAAAGWKQSRPIIWIVWTVLLVFLFFNGYR
jgi:beta-lactamase regulating signal transducer with metallopeptidase domain